MKKGMQLLLSFIFILILGVFCYRYFVGDSKVISKKDDYMLKNLDKNIDEISRIYNGKFIIREDKKYGIMNTEGKRIKNSEYDLIIRIYKDTFYFQKDGKGTLSNLESNKSIIVNEVEKLNNDYFKILSENKYGIIDGELNIVLETEYDFIMNNNYHILAFKGNESELYDNFIKRKKLKYEYRDIRLGIGKYIYVRENSKWGIIDENGNSKTDIKYNDFLELNNENIVIGYLDGDRYLIDLENNVEKKVEYENYGSESQGIIMVLKNGKIGYIDNQGKEIIPTAYDGGFMAKENKDFFQVKKDGKWVLLNREGKEYKTLEYNDIGEYQEGYMVVEQEGQFGYIDNQGELKIPLEYMFAGEFKNNRAIVAQDNGFGLIDRMNNKIIPLIYDNLKIKGDYVCVTQDNKLGLLTINGNEILPLVYDKLEIVDKNLVFFKKGEDTGYLRVGEEG